MAKGALLGNKVRQFRRGREIPQVEMARRLGISPSYLNLIEHNQRPLTIPLLLKLAETFDIELQAFSEDEGARLLADMSEIFTDPLFNEHELRREGLQEIVGTAPDLCQAVLTLYRAYRNSRDDIEALSERLSDQSFLSTSAHELRTLMTSVRSFAEILHEHQDLDVEQRQQFITIIARESSKFTGIINQMLSYASVDGRGAKEGNAAPAEEVTDFLHDHRNHFPEIEEAAEQFRDRIGFGSTHTLSVLADTLERDHGFRVEIGPHEADAGVTHRLDPDRQRLYLSEVLPASSRRFQVARQIGLLALEDLFDLILVESELSSPESTALAREVMANYFAGAVLMPYDVFLDGARTLRHDIELLGRRFGTSFEQVCQRLTTLQRRGDAGIPFFFLRIDIAGNASKRLNTPGLNIPRYGGICPRWAIHTAFLTPGRIQRQLMRLGDGGTYFNVARTVFKPSGGHREPARHFAIGLGCEKAYADKLVYSDGMDLTKTDAAIPVGTTCPLCERGDCLQRALPTILPSHDSSAGAGPKSATG